MSLVWMGSAVAIAAVNLVLLTVLTVVWLRNYRTFRSTLLLGLLLFAGVLAVENLVAITAYLTTGMVTDGGMTAKAAVLGLRVLQHVAIAFLTVVTLFPSWGVSRLPDLSAGRDHG